MSTYEPSLNAYLAPTVETQFQADLTAAGGAGTAAGLAVIARYKKGVVGGFDGQLPNLLGTPSVTGLSVGIPLFVLNPSGDTTGATDFVAIQTALNDAIPTAGTVVLNPGTYYTNASIIVGPPAANTTHVAVPAPSLVAFTAAGHIGDTLFPTERAQVEIVASSTFPVGKLMLDFQENVTTGEQWTGAWVKGLNFSCASRGAGVRFQGVRQFNVEDITVAQPATMSGYTTPESGGFNIVSVIAFQTAPAWSTYRRCTVEGANLDGFWLNSNGQESLWGCHAVGYGRYGFVMYASCSVTLFGCDSQASAGTGTAQWYVNNAQAIIVGSTLELTAGSPNAVVLDGCSAYVKFIGCEFTNSPGAAPGEQGGAMVNVKSSGNTNQAVRFTGCEFRSTANTTDWVYVAAATASGTVSFNDCIFNGAVTTNKFNDASTANVLRFRNCPGINPVGVVTPVVPASGTPVAAISYDRTFYVSTVAGTTTCSMAIQGGPTVPFIGAVAQVLAVRVPAGQTVTPTYTGTAPTWVVEGE